MILAALLTVAWKSALGAAILVVGVELIALGVSGEASWWLLLIGSGVLGLWHSVFVS